MKKVHIFCDGACLGNPGPGGWAALLKYGSHEKLVSGGEADSTNNRMELTAAIEGLRILNEACHAKITTDSRYVINAFEKGWLDSWHRNGWKTSGKDDVKNQDLWEELFALTQRHKVTWEWVKGHSGHPENEIVDKKAREEAGNLP